ncbi:hypothetical protein V1520DRAFT_332180 [Lipomyces starkeyi]|uniref:Uncharacterized protein n=1 Tax=Lipomyces starkeyi NRRL Y-11557 TaxID=675824 RepID=A0A1E3Q2S4_LIPST|nr:hypothetical protein LIPSTDRAFT_64127 [Lipomyces starkeyi NRRL Y-11557]
MSASPQVTRRVLGDVSANIMHTPHTAINKHVDLYAAAADCSSNARKTGPAPASESKVALEGNVEGQDAGRQCKITLPSSPQQPSCGDIVVRHPSTTDEIQHGLTQSQTRRLPSPASVRRSSCKVHADRLRMRLRLAMYKVRINQTTTPLCDLPLPPSALLSGSTTFTSSILPLMSSSQPPLISEILSGTRAITGMRTASLYNADANVSASIAALRLQSLPAVMSDAAIRIATGVSNKPQLPRRKKMGTFIHNSGPPQSAAKFANRAASYSFDTATSNGRWSGRSKKHHRSSKRARISGAIMKDVSKKRPSNVSVPDSSGPLQDNSVAVVTPARKRSSGPDKMLVVPKLGAEAEGSSGMFSSPFKSQLPSSAIKGTPGQIGAARSLLELGCL